MTNQLMVRTDLIFLDKLAINQQLKYVNSIELDTVKSVMKMYGYNYTSGSATIIDLIKCQQNIT